MSILTKAGEASTLANDARGVLSLVALALAAFDDALALLKRQALRGGDNGVRGRCAHVHHPGAAVCAAVQTAPALPATERIQRDQDRARRPCIVLRDAAESEGFVGDHTSSQRGAEEVIPDDLV